MARIPYVSDHDAAPAELVAQIRARRGGALLNLDRMLLHSPALARGWNAYFDAVRGGLSLPPKTRELAICAVAVLNEAEYEFAQHLRPFLMAGGTEEAARALRDGHWDDAVVFDATERATLRLTREMTEDVKIGDATFAQARAALGSDAKLVELVAVIATYNMVSRFLVAMGVEIETQNRIQPDSAVP